VSAVSMCCEEVLCDMIRFYEFEDDYQVASFFRTKCQHPTILPCHTTAVAMCCEEVLCDMIRFFEFEDDYQVASFFRTKCQHPTVLPCHTTAADSLSPNPCHVDPADGSQNQFPLQHRFSACQSFQHRSASLRVHVRVPSDARGIRVRR
jgi:hypothetical protein